MAEMKERISHRFPTTTYEMYQGEDPVGIYLAAIVDTDDLDEVKGLFLDRLVDLQVDEGLPLFVVPVRPVDRVSPNCAAARRWRCRLRCRSVEGRNHGTAAHSFGKITALDVDAPGVGWKSLYSTRPHWSWDALPTGVSNVNSIGTAPKLASLRSSHFSVGATTPFVSWRRSESVTRP